MVLLWTQSPAEPDGSDRWLACRLSIFKNNTVISAKTKVSRFCVTCGLCPQRRLVGTDSIDDLIVMYCLLVGIVWQIRLVGTDRRR